MHLLKKPSTRYFVSSKMLFVLLTILIDSTGFGIIVPILPKLMEDITGASIGLISVYGGWMIFIFSVFQFIFAPILGSLSDKFGRKPVLVISLIGLGLDYFILFFANSLMWLFIGRLLAGIMGSSVTTATAYAADISDNKTRPKNFGLIEATVGIGFILGPVIGGVVGSWLGVRAPFLLAGFLSLANAIYGILFVPESLAKSKRSNFTIKNINPFGLILQFIKLPNMIWVMMGYFVLHLAVASFHTVWVFVIIEKFNWQPDLIGYALGVFGLSLAIIQGFFAGSIIKMMGEKLTIILGTVLNILIYVLISISNKGWQMFVLAPLFELGWVSMTAFMSLAASMVKPKDQGKLQGVITSLMSMTNIMSALIMPQIFYFFANKTTSYYFPGAPFALSAILALIGLFICIRWLSKKNQNFN